MKNWIKLLTLILFLNFFTFLSTVEAKEDVESATKLPEVVYVEPANHSTLPVNQKVIWFQTDKEIKKGSADILLYETTTKEKVPLSFGVYYGTICSIELLDALKENTTYTLEVEKGAVTDPTGNPLEGFSFTFQTSDVKTPVVVESEPARFAANVPIIDAIKVIYDTEIELIYPDKVWVSQANVGHKDKEVTVDGNVLTIKLKEPTEVNAVYSINVPNMAIRSKEGIEGQNYWIIFDTMTKATDDSDGDSPNGSDSKTGTETNKKLDKLTIENNDITLSMGSSKDLTLTAVYNDKTSEDVTSKATWTSSNERVVIVDQNGVITTKKTGKATITAKYKNKTVKVDVKVIEKNPTEITVGKKQTVTLKINGGKAPYQVVLSDPKIAEVKVSGKYLKIKGLANGITSVTVMDYKNKTIQFDVFVVKEMAINFE